MADNIGFLISMNVIMVYSQDFNNQVYVNSSVGRDSCKLDFVAGLSITCTLHVQ